MSIREKAEFFLAVNNYKSERTEKWSDGIDFVTSDELSNEKVFVRLIDSQRKSGYIGSDEVKSMQKAMKRKGFSRGVLVGKKFTDAANQEMNAFNIQKVSEDYMPPIKAEQMLLIINDNIDNLCKARCGAVPVTESDCKGHLKESLCRVRSINDDTLFHLECGWMNLVENDLRQLLLLNKAIKA